MGHLNDCIVVGGGAAGLNAALVLGRARRRTVLVDAAKPSNLPAHGIGGALGHDGRPPAELYALGRAELARYPSVETVDGSVVDARATGSRGTDDGFEVELAGGAVLRSRTMILALGMDYLRPDIRGVEQRWGSSVFHCPFCHGWEVRDKPLGICDPGPMGAMRARLLRAWSDDVTWYAFGSEAVSDEDRDALDAAGIRIEAREIVQLHGPAPDLTEVALADGTRAGCGGLMVAAGLRQRSDLAVRLGAETFANPMSEDLLVTDHLGQTTVPGVWAAGDTAGVMPSVVNAMASGSTTAAQVVHHLMLG